MKRRFTKWLCVCFIFSLMVGVTSPVRSSAGLAEVSIRENQQADTKKGKTVYYTCGNFLYSLEDEEAIIRGYVRDGNEVVEMDTLVIPSEVDGYPVTEIGFGAFECNRTVLADETRVIYTLYFDKVIIPKGVKKIGSWAFADCLVKEIELPEGVEVIGSWAFCNCKKLRNIKFPQSLKKIAFAAFVDCENLRKIEIPEMVEVINESTFSGCKKLKKVKLHENLDYIDSFAFNECISLRKLEIPDSVMWLGEYIIGTDTYTESYYKRKTKIIMHSMKTVAEESAFWGVWMDLWIYPGADAEEEITGYDKLHYMKPSLSKKLTVKKKEKENLVMYGADKKVRWTVENPKIAKVIHEGGKRRNVYIKGKKAGETTITASFGGKSYQCRVKVS